MKKRIKSVCMTIVIGAILASTALKPMVAFAWGDSDGGRPSYTLEEVNQGILGDSIVFNSISDSVIGDEKNFVAAREDTGINAGPANVWNANDITVENGKVYIIRLYVHNNSPKGYDAVSKNTRVAFSIPNISAKQIQVNGHIFSDNAAPIQYWDYVNFNADVPFHLEYVEGSALLENNGIGNDGGVQLNDNIVYKAASEHGVQIGYSLLNGDIPGCYSYACYVGIKVKVVYDYEFDAEGKVRLAGINNETWYDSLDARVGDHLEFIISYKNTGGETQPNVTVKNILPDGLYYVEGTAKLHNENYPNGMIIPNAAIDASSINIGDYAAGSNAYITFTAEVTDGAFANGSNTLVNWIQVSVCSTTQQCYIEISQKETEMLVITVAVLIGLITICSIFSIGLHHKLQRLKDCS